MRRVLFREKLISYFKMMSRRKERFLADFLITMTFVSGMALGGAVMQRTRATGADELTGTSYGCTLTGTVATAHSASIGLGESVTDFGTTKITTICESSNDHQIYAIGYSNNTEGNTDLIQTEDITIPTGTTTGDVSNWSMKISRDESSFLYKNLDIQNGFDSNHVVPDESTMVSSYLGGTDSTTGSSIFTTYSAKVSSSQIAGDYYGKVKYTLVASTTTGITIKTNTGISKVRLGNKECTSSEGCLITGLVTGEVLELVAELEEGYYFENWATVEEGVIGDNTLASTIYTVGQNSETLTPSAKPKIQNIDASQCTATPAIFYDERDGHAYTIQRLLDGKCWMMENLDLGRTTLTKDLTSENTNLKTTIPASTFNGWEKTTSSGTFDSGEFITVDGNDSVSGTAYGTIYNYYAASAGTISGRNVTEDSKYDICPAGWRLPTGGANNEYSTLYAQYNTPELMRASIANNGAAFALAGYFGASGGTAGQEEDGRYWTSSNYSEIQMINLGTRPQQVVATAARGRNLGDSIRCVLKKQISDLEYMQDFNSLTESEYKSVFQSMKNRTAYQLVDNRDNRTYEIAKLPDGRIWMANNLDLGRTPIETDLTSDNTNVSSTNTITSTTFNGWRGAQSYSNNAVNPVPDPDYGTLYNFFTAIARTNNTGSGYGYGAGFFASQDLCPAGWRLPIGTNHGDYTKLANLVGINNLRKPVVEGGGYFNFAGKITNSTMQSQGTEGTFWTNAGHMDYMIFTLTTSTSYTPASDAYEYMMDSFSVRCTAKRKITQVITLSIGTGVSSVRINGITVADGGTIELEQGTTYMIEAELASGYGFNEWNANNAEIGSPKTQYTTIELNDSPVTLSVSALATNTNLQNLAPENCGVEPISAIDNRDGQTYVIQRLRDGNCWFMDNLNLGQTNLTDDLTSSNTNIAETVTAATFNGWSKYKNSGRDSESGAKFGVHYVETAARAGGSSGSEYDICPAGWRLPTTDEYTSLINIYKANNRRIPAHDGGLAHADAVQRSSGTTYWTIGVSSAFYWTQGGYYTNASTGTSYDVSRTVRCVLKQPLERQITFVIDSGIKSISVDGDTLEGTSINLLENKEYTISANFNPGYAYPSWTVTSGTITETSGNALIYKVGSENATITVNTNNLTTEMQNLASTNCTTTPSYAMDNRDNQIYLIQRLADGRCWMMNNLNLGASELETDLTSSNTNLSETITASTFNSWKKASGTNTYNDGEFIPLDGVDIVATTPYGTLYNYYAISAGTINGSSNTEDATYDICPAGWRLPTGGSSGDLGKLVKNSAYNSAAIIRAPIAQNGLQFPLSGYFYTSTPTNRNSTSYYWTSSVYSSTYMRYLSLSSTSFGVDNSVMRGYGGAARCILKENNSQLTVQFGPRVQAIEIEGVTLGNGDTINLEQRTTHTVRMIPAEGARPYRWSINEGSIDYTNPAYATITVGVNDAIITADAIHTDKILQNITDNDCTMNMSYAYDNRDGQVYAFQRLLDGKCWMIDNLNLGAVSLETDLTSSNTNLSTTVSAETFNTWKNTSFSSTTNGAYKVISGADNVSKIAYGSVYNFYAASAGTISGSVNMSNARNDICPAGWRLPINNMSSYSEYKNIYQEYDTVAKIRAATGDGGAAFAPAGYSSGSTGTIGYYWSSTRYTDNYMMGLYIPNNSINISYNLSRTSGYSMRCVKKKPTKTITVSYGTGVTNVYVDAVSVANNSTIELEQGVEYQVTADFQSGYGINSWSSDHGSFKHSDAATTTYTPDENNSTITVSGTTVTKVMQNLNDANCTTTPSYVKDNRDNQIYLIQRLADGNCWMMDNLNLGAVQLSSDLTSSNTNITTTVSASTFNGWIKTSATNTYTDGVIILKNGIDFSSYSKMGALYNYYAVSAGTINGSSVSTDLTYDICPAGWHLPAGNSTGDFSTLYKNNAYNSLEKAWSPSHDGGLAYAGSGYLSSSITNTANGYYWTSTRSGTTNFYYFNITLTSVSYTSNYSRQYLLAARCIKDSDAKITTLTYLQDFRNFNDNDKYTVKKTMSPNTIYNLKDNRDNKTYGIAKFNDGRIWMVDNLDLGRTTLSTDLTSSNSNLESTVTASTFNGWKKTTSSGTYTSGEFIPISGSDSTNSRAYGTLYNYYAATGGTISGNSNSKNAEFDICPAGWRLPTGGSSNTSEAYILGSYYSGSKGNATVSSGGLSLPRAGNFTTSTPVNAGSYGYFWTSTNPNSAQTRNYLYVSSSSFSYSSSGQRRYGYSIRCITK